MKPFFTVLMTLVLLGVPSSHSHESLLPGPAPGPSWPPFPPIPFLTLPDLPDPDGVSKDPELIGFYLFPNSEDLLDYDVLRPDDVESVRSSRYDASKKLILYSSGFLQNATTDQAIKNAYLKAGFASQANIVVIEWGYLSGNKATIPEEDVDLFITRLYFSVKPNVEVVGQRTFQFIQFLENNGFLQEGPGGVHIVGQSMGAHVAGYAGYFYQGSSRKLLGRITATDAAGPLFIAAPLRDRLDFTDAVFVDALHTNDDAYGFSAAGIADVDFLVNGGKSPQPGCEEGEGFCSHNLAVEFYAKSILDPSIRAISAVGPPLPIPFGEYAPTHVKGPFNVELTPEY